jgi:RNA polymerase sigma-70 factor (ECF subfamily)
MDPTYRRVDLNEMNLDRDELESQVERRRSHWVRMAYRILRDRQEAEDVVQETLMAVLRQPGDIGRLDAYISRAVDWNAVKRRARQRSFVALDDIPEPRAANQLDPLELEQAVTGLPPALQTIIRLRFYLGLTFAEIGKNLSISINTAASRCRYALERMRKVLRPAAQIHEGIRHE